MLSAHPEEQPPKGYPTYLLRKVAVEAWVLVEFDSNIGFGNSRPMNGENQRLVTDETG